MTFCFAIAIDIIMGEGNGLTEDQRSTLFSDMITRQGKIIIAACNDSVLELALREERNSDGTLITHPMADEYRLAEIGHRYAN